MIALTQIRTLDLATAPAAGRPLHLSAASGIACVGSFIYVVADDELHLGVFRSENGAPGHLIRLFDGELPDKPKKRKKQKPDCEALALLPASADYPHGALLALGSGSRPNRRMGALLGLDPQGAVDGPPRTVDLSPMLAPLDDAFASVNIEGAVVFGDELRLFQRGNKQQGVNAVIRFGLSALLDALRSERTAAIKPAAIDEIDLGQIDEIPFGFTDAAALPDGDMVFTAVAEDTENTYDDGACAGAGVGIVDNEGRLRCLHQIDRRHKVEGIDARLDGNTIRLLLVTDADDASIPASLCAATMAR